MLVSELVGSSVLLVRWPEEAHRLPRLRELGIPRLLLVGPDDQPPDDQDGMADWVRLPASDADIWARVRRPPRLAAEWSAEELPASPMTVAWSTATAGSVCPGSARRS